MSMITDMVLLSVMNKYYYLATLVIAFCGVLLADRHFKLLTFKNRKRIIAAAVCFFLAWDIIGLALKVFATNQHWVSGLHFGTPNLPIEEVLFLAFLSYITLVLWRLVWQR